MFFHFAHSPTSATEKERGPRKYWRTDGPEAAGNEHALHSREQPPVPEATVKVVPEVQLETVNSIRGWDVMRSRQAVYPESQLEGVER
jgi:hypothetical protein